MRNSNPSNMRASEPQDKIGIRHNITNHVTSRRFISTLLSAFHAPLILKLHNVVRSLGRRIIPTSPISVAMNHNGVV